MLLDVDGLLGPIAGELFEYDRRHLDSESIFGPDSTSGQPTLFRYSMA